MHKQEIAPKHDRLVWIDLEMTGLEPDRHVIVEIAAVITDGNLNICLLYTSPSPRDS